MKTKLLLTILLASLCYSLGAQVNNFSVSDSNQLFWQKVYESEMTYDDIHNELLNGGYFTDILNNDGIITCRMPRTTVDVKALGYDRGSIPIYVSITDISGFVTIQVKDGRYRVTVDNIILTYNDSAVSDIGESNPIETWATNKNALRKGFAGKPSVIYNTIFTDLFSFRPKAYLNDEW